MEADDREDSDQDTTTADADGGGDAGLNADAPNGLQKNQECERRNHASRKARGESDRDCERRKTATTLSATVSNSEIRAYHSPL